MFLHLVRHAQSENNAKPEHERVEDPGLTELGIEQAHRFGDWLASQKDVTAPQKIYVSPFYRTLLTSEPTYSQTKIETHIYRDLHEVGGCYAGWHAQNIRGRPGMGRDAIRAKYTHYNIPADYPSHGWWPHPHRESDEAAIERGERVAKDLIARYRHSKTNLLCFTHADFLTVLIAALQKDDTDWEKAAHIWNTSITTFEINPNDVKLVQYNQAPHLSRDLLSH